ncbi:MAG: nitrilase-related carbon-nitrogen hydrolase [Pseudomonadota bacterium]|nr:nitrilase-related carbon-nitrogen hydrolase [Pseudomonadota bacterium]
MNILVMQWNAIWQETKANLNKFEKELPNQLNQLSDNIDLVVLPEIFHAGFSMNPELFSESAEGEVSQTLASLAKQNSINIVAGVAQRKVRSNCDGKQVNFFNTALTFNSKGEQTGSYAKQKLFSYACEDKTYTAGYKPEIIHISGEPFALFICYDLRFPELFREVANKVKGFIVLANWPEARQAHWEALLKARAIENQCFVIGVNRIGQDGNGLHYGGGSSVISPQGELLLYADKNTEVSVVEINLQEVGEVRKQFPFLKDMKS